MVFDCFMFYNELELLELRLNELDAVVDRFVLVESTKTLPGKPKPLYFAENRDRFAPFLKKIIHVVVDDMPGGDGPRDHWMRERHQRNCIARGLKDCAPDDVIMVSDVDEIPDPQTISRFIAGMEYRDDVLSKVVHVAFNSRLTRFVFHRKGLKRLLRKNNPFVWKLEQYPCWYFLNRRTRDVEWWYGTKIMHYRDYSIAEEMRHSGYKVVKGGGWHFSFMGDAERMKTKIAATAHQEINNAETIAKLLRQTTMERVAEELEEGSIVLLAEQELPAFIQAHPEKFSSWLIDPATLPRSGA